MYLFIFLIHKTFSVFFFQAEDGIRDAQESRGLGDVYKRQPFEELNPEDLNTSVMKYVKAVLQLEKGLPPNGVVPILKEKVESMRSKV